MLRLRSAAGRLLHYQPKSIAKSQQTLPPGVGPVIRPGNARQYQGSGGGKTRQGQAVRQWVVWVLGGASAITLTGTALALYPRLGRDAAVGVREAGCLEQRERRAREPAGVSTTTTSRPIGVDEAIRVSRELLQRAKDESGSPGIVAAVSVDGKLVWADGLGFADVENRQVCTPDTVMRVASISKSFTMAAVAKLWEQGKLDLDKPVQHYVPSFPKKEFDGEEVDISTRQLVSHLAGIRHYSKDYIKKLGKQQQPAKGKSAKPAADGAKEPHKAGNGDEDQDPDQGKHDGKFKEFLVTDNYKSVVDALDMFKDDPLMHKPGGKYHYTTHGWTLISAVVDAVADRDFLDHMEALFRELGMPHTVPDKAKPLIYNRARCYRRDKKGRLVNAPTVNLSHKWAGGGFLSDVQDLIQFGNTMLYSCQYTDSHKVAGFPPGYLKAKTMEDVWCPVPLTKTWDKEGAYAMGWAVRTGAQSCGLCPERPRLVSHTGAAVGASSVLLLVDRREGGKSKQVVHSESSGGNLELAATDADPKCLTLPDAPALPRGIVVALIVNLENVSLYQTALNIAETFQKVNSPH